MKIYKDYIENLNNIDYDKIIYKNNNFFIGNVVIKNNRAINNDIVYYNYKEVINIKKRSEEYIVGILVINDKKKYGFNKKHNPYYLFKPLNNKYPNFLVSLSKSRINNIYVCIRFNKWDNNSLYPIGTIIDIIGDIDIYENQIKCYLYKNNLIYPQLKISKEKIEHDKNINIKDYKYEVFTIDPEKCKDIDDSISFKKTESEYIVGVHITDVSYYINNLEDINCKLYLEDKLTSSIYYNNNQINMIPNIYAENICSLLENTKKKCISILFKFDKNYKLINYKIELSNVFVKKNLSYNEAEVYIKTNNKEYDYLLNIWDFMKKYDNSIKNTHELIEKLMILCNKTIGEILYNYDKKKAIMRIHKERIKKITEKKYDEELDIYLNKKNMNSAFYSCNQELINHFGLNLELYTHFTSPIRRYIDIINHINIKNYLLKKELLNINENIINHINNINKYIKKFNNDSKIIDLIKKNENIKKYYDSYIIKININYLLIYIVELNLEYKYKIYNNKLSNIYKINNITNNKIEIKDNNNKIIRFNRFEKIKISIINFKNEYELLNKLKVSIIINN